MTFKNEKTENEKEIKFASGLISYFGDTEKNNNSDKLSLDFDGTFDDGEKIKRNIKISKYVKGYDGNDHSQLYKNQYPKKENIYRGSIQLETWEWEGHNCLRVIAFEIDEDLGINENYQENNNRDNNPFTNRK